MVRGRQQDAVWERGSGWYIPCGTGVPRATFYASRMREIGVQKLRPPNRDLPSGAPGPVGGRVNL